MFSLPAQPAAWARPPLRLPSLPVPPSSPPRAIPARLRGLSAGAPISSSTAAETMRSKRSAPRPAARASTPRWNIPARAKSCGCASNALRLGGTFCPVGGELREIPLRVVDMVSKELNVHGIRGATRNDQRVVVELLEKGRIRMPIHAVLPLAKAAQAHAMLEPGEGLVGRIVLHPWDDV